MKVRFRTAWVSQKEKMPCFSLDMYKEGCSTDVAGSHLLTEAWPTCLNFMYSAQ